MNFYKEIKKKMKDLKASSPQPPQFIINKATYESLTDEEKNIVDNSKNWKIV